ncbi:MAG TPA: sugar transferase, partial [Candidatus Saccharimonadales bacterium]|nr:sugar transferase [Candidatus Saccharimonadales bacterium]
MPTKNVRFYTVALIIVDILAVLAAITIAYTLRVKLDPRPITVHIHAIEFFLVFVRLLPVWLLAFWAIGMYAPRNYEKRQFEIGRLAIGSAVGVLLIIGYSYFNQHEIFPTRIVPIYAAIALFALLVIGREALRLIRKVAHRYGYDVRRVVIIGSGAATADLIKTLGLSGRTGYKVVAVVGGRTDDKSIERFTSLDKALESLERLEIDVIIQTSLYDEAERNQIVMSAALDRHIQYSFIPGEAEFYSGKNQIDVFMGYPIINVYHTPLIGWGKVVKQVSDLFFTLITLPIWGLIVLIIAILQKFLNPGPVFYSSRRLTRYSKAFGLMKFRTMGAQYGQKDAAEEFR